MQGNPASDGQTGAVGSHNATPWILGVIALIISIAAIAAMNRRRDGARRSDREPYTQPRT
jgi:hypothetical protein